MHRMRGDVWQRLPDELLERVLTMLPLPSLLQLRAVSKSWSSLILSQDFINQCAHNDNRPHLLLITALAAGSVSSIAVFSPASGNWSSVSLGFLGDGSDEATVLCAAGGLVSVLSAGSRIVVCNPLTRSWRQLPPLKAAATPPLLVTMMVDGSGYKMLVAAPDGWHDDRTFLYDSAAGGEWRRQGDLPQGVLGFETEGIAAAGSVFAITSPPFRLLQFDLALGEWSKSTVPLPEGAASPRLVLCSRELLLVAAVGGGATGDDTAAAAPSSAIGAWRLFEAQRWEPLQALPLDFFRGMFKGDHYWELDSCRCVGRGEWLYFISYDGALLCRFSLSHRQWDWLPTFKPIVGSFITGMMVLEPALVVAV